MMIYLAHPYNGKRENFDDASQMATGIHAATKHAVFNPLDEFAHYGIAYSEREILDFCKGALETCDCAMFSRGWEKSKGCRYEHFIATVRGIQIIYLDDIDETVFREFAKGGWAA